jgi:electron transfer flavoprotein alpha subunit
MGDILVVAERVGGALDESTFELAGLARMLSPDGNVRVALLGDGAALHGDELAAWFDNVHVCDSPVLAAPGGDIAAAVLAPLVRNHAPEIVLIPHTNTGLDFAPGLAVNTGRPLITDCVEVSRAAEGLSAVRPVYGGKVHARFSVKPNPNGYMVTVRPGAVPVPSEAPGAGGAVSHEDVPADLPSRRRFVRTVEPEKGDVDVTAAEILVAVGRGIEDEDNIEMIESLAEALGAEVVCTRPVVDKGWLPKTRQVGTSGVTVKPKIYLAVGVSGSFQHMGGVKGSPFLAAINSDPRAPIFGVADVGLVGDLFEIVPELEEKIRAHKG